MEEFMSEQIRHAPAHATSARSSLLPLLRRLHFDIGLFIAPFIFIAAFTGTLYVVTPQLEKVLYQRQLFISSSGADQPLSAQVVRASEFIGADAQIAAVRPAPYQGETTRVMFYRADLAPSETRAVFIDPKTLEVRGVMTVYGTSGILPLRTWLDYLHRNLLLGDVGRIYSELAASWLWVAAFGGALLWASNRAARRQSSTPQPPPARRLGRFRRWHTAVGLALLLGMVFFSATGLTWSRWAGDNIALLRSHFGWMTPVVNTSLQPAPAMDMAMDEHAGHHGHSMIMHGGEAVTINPARFDSVLHAARAAGIDAAKLEIRPAYRTDKAWTVTETDHRWPTQVDSVAVDPQNNTIVDKVTFAQFGLLARLTRWGVDAHMGVLFGIANQLVLALFGLGLCLMIVIGYRMWWLRRPQAGETSPFATLLGCWRQLTPGIRLMLLVLTVLVAVSLPVMGVSLPVLLAIDRWRWQRSMK
ncbi:PepSY-associated TM helix domain-containing protein [Erwinia pyrifoliae]|uniref:PepSY domain-containing protein n=1 Tax=Erwinia pyrifoliae TaxID=79967 RepID=A0ABY5X6A0_ERWPY|nr:PepSY-associated TM helix domain-containing protein [Erwinia pyrifoliae]MCA8875868.1 PepSY domain-containing protein [Erwinia pyrifoliae]UWS28783.1 PepSY domain-containing protein [Erwinia pyrifoliae]UWS32926.1 PepSY domain-containing protein [Erwinia pyrifoliae]UXK11774.1 PepSY domain-containing protein [Erwinia pyrifoliae]CAX54383.1 Putative iron-regulated membrane protein [Erwinia pyrifoliae Ep1/96]